MICGFVDKNYDIEIKDIIREDAQAIATTEKNFAINVNNEYYIFFAKEIYIEENTEKNNKIISDLNKKLIKYNQL